MSADSDGWRPLEHLPDRPSWRCRVCDQAWPCELAKAGLRQTLDPVSLGIYAGAQLYAATGDLPGVAPEELWDRFVAWTRS